MASVLYRLLRYASGPPSLKTSPSYLKVRKWLHENAAANFEKHNAFRLSVSVDRPSKSKPCFGGGSGALLGLAMLSCTLELLTLTIGMFQN